MPLEPKTKTIILRSVAGLAVVSAGLFSWAYFINKDDDGITKYQKSKLKSGSGSGGSGGGKGGDVGVDMSTVSTSDFPIEIGSRNKAVVLLQVALKHKWKENINVDGRFGTSTRDAMINKFFYLFGDSTSPSMANIWIRLPFTKFEITETGYNGIVKGVDFKTLFNQNPTYRQMFNQYQQFNG